MKRFALALLAGAWLVAAPGAAALVLGDIEVGSLRGEPLMARIALLEMPEGGPDGLTVGLGGAEDFARAGIERADHLESLGFLVIAEGPEPAHVMIMGRAPIDSSFFTFLVEAVWSEGRTLREYTVLLDAAPLEAAASYGPVREVDTLWSLAGRYRPEGISVQRMMLTILALNPHAFSIENVNALREGAVLEIPAPERIGPDDKASAMQDVNLQNEAWQVHFPSIEGQASADDVGAGEVSGAAAVAPPPDPEADAEAYEEGAIGRAPEAVLTVIAPGTGQAASADEQRRLQAELALALEEGDSRRQGIFDLSARLDEAEQLIADLQRLVELKDDDIAGLQRRLAAESEAAMEARSEVSAQAQLVARAQEEAQAQAEAAARARQEAQVQADAAAKVRAEVAASARAEITELVSAQAQAAPEPFPEQEEDGAIPVDTGVDDEVEGAEEEEVVEIGPGESAASLSFLKTLEDLLGFSPVVGGVGLVGVILILGGLVALMRRRGSGRDDADDDDNLDEDASEPWEDEEVLEVDAAGSGEGDPSAVPVAQTSIGGEPDVDDFDIGIDLDEELTRSFEEDYARDSHLDREATALERALTPDREAGSGLSSSRSAIDSAPPSRSEFVPESGDEDVAGGLGSRPLEELADGSSGLARGRQGAASAALRGSGGVDRFEDGAVFGTGESLAGDIDELQTKLDLAQTYIDMEDFEGARTLLREVQAEGGLEQRAIARYLSGKLP